MLNLMLETVNFTKKFISINSAILMFKCHCTCLSTACDGVLHPARVAGLPHQGPVLLPTGEHPREDCCVDRETLHSLCFVPQQGIDSFPKTAQAHSNCGPLWKQCKFGFFLVEIIYSQIRMIHKDIHYK